MIYPETGWFEIIQKKDKQASTISNLGDKIMLCRYPRPTIIKYGRGNEFLSHTFKIDLLKNEYRIKSKCETMENPQDN